MSAAVSLASTIPPAKVCLRCHRQYSVEAFDALQFVGLQNVPADDTGPEENVPLHNCPDDCGTTLARQSIVGPINGYEYLTALVREPARVILNSGIYPFDTELEDVSGAYCAREVWDEFTDREDFAQESP